MRGRGPELWMSGGCEFQRRGAEQLKALFVVLRQAKGTVRWIEEEDLREQGGLAMCRRLERYGRVRL